MIAFLLIAAVVLGISIVGMLTSPSEPMLGEDSGYDVLEEEPGVIERIPERPVVRRA